MLLACAPSLNDLTVLGELDRAAFSHCRFFRQISSIYLDLIPGPAAEADINVMLRGLVSFRELSIYFKNELCALG